MATDPVQLYHACASPSARDREAGFRALGDILYVALWRHVADRDALRHLAEESRQEALATVWKKLRDGHGPDSAEHFVGWAVVIATNKLREAIRTRETRARLRPGRRVAASRVHSLDEPAAEGGAALGDLLAAPDATAAHVEQMEALAQLLDVLQTSPAISESSRTVLIRGYLEGWDDDELAALLGTSRGNIHVIRCRALAKLRAEPEFMAWLRALRLEGG